MTHDHDNLFHHTYSQQEHAISLLRAVLPRTIARAVDWSSLRLLPGTSVDESLQQRRSDLLFVARVHGKPVLLYLLIEHKSTGEHLTVLQLLCYLVRVYDRCLEDQAGAETLPPIVPIVVHNGERPFRAPRSLFELIDLHGLPKELVQALAPLQPDLHFLLDDLATTKAAELASRDGTVLDRLTMLALQFTRSGAERDPVGFASRFRDLLAAMLTHPSGRRDLYAILCYLAARLEVRAERLIAATAIIHEEARKMGKTIADQWLEEGMRKGEAKGRTEGRVEGRRGAHRGTGRIAAAPVAGPLRRDPGTRRSCLARRRRGHSRPLGRTDADRQQPRRSARLSRSPGGGTEERGCAPGSATVRPRRRTRLPGRLSAGWSRRTRW